jgi:hypothetical protein
VLSQQAVRRVRHHSVPALHGMSPVSHHRAFPPADWISGCVMLGYAILFVTKILVTANAHNADEHRWTRACSAGGWTTFAVT